MEPELIQRVLHAERQLAEDKRRIASLVRLIDELRRDGRDTAAAEEVLEFVSTSQQLQVAATKYGQRGEVACRILSGPGRVNPEPQSAALNGSLVQRRHGWRPAVPLTRTRAEAS